TEAGLQFLPGIGTYTAAAIAAIAFGRRAAAVDGNAERVLARLFAIETPLPAARSEIKAKAQEMVPIERPGDFAQAVMDLGATICAPKRPACGICPLLKFCRGHASGSPENLPRRVPRRERPLRQGAAFFVRRRDGAVLVRTRPDAGLLGGMTEIPGTDWETNFNAASAASLAPLKASYRKLDREVTHAFTHFALRLDIYVAEVPTKRRVPAGYRFVPDCGLDRQAFPSVMRKIIEAVRKDAVLEHAVTKIL
ncbi:MAG: NUDIX domain-containing protein, partial [Methylocella sp.]